MTTVTNPHFKLKSHERNRGTFRGALSTNGLATLPTVMLAREKNEAASNYTQDLAE